MPARGVWYCDHLHGEEIVCSALVCGMGTVCHGLFLLPFGVTVRLRFVALPGYLVYYISTAFGARAKEKSQEGQVQSNVNSSNIFWTMEICSRHGCSSH